MSVSRRRMLMASTSGLEPGEVGPFGNIVFYRNPVVYENNTFRFQTSWNEKCSFKSKYGLTNGSTYFNSPQAQNISIPGYRLGTFDEYKAVTGSIARAGSTYNGVSGALWAPIFVSAIKYPFNQTAIVLNGYIVFPDGYTITGPTLGLQDPYTRKTITETQFNSLLDQGVMFFPCAGRYDSESYGSKWSRTDYKEEFNFLLCSSDLITYPYYMDTYKSLYGYAGQPNYSSSMELRLASPHDGAGGHEYYQIYLCRKR